MQQHSLIRRKQAIARAHDPPTPAAQSPSPGSHPPPSLAVTHAAPAGHDLGNIAIYTPAEMGDRAGETGPSGLRAGREATATGRPPIAVQRDATGLPPVPDVTLRTPALLQTPPPAFAPAPDPDVQLHLDPQIEAATQHVDQALAPTSLKSALGTLRLRSGAAPPSPPANPSTPAPPAPPAGPPPGPDVPAGGGPDTPHAAGVGDLMGAVLAVPAIDAAINDLRTRATDHVRADWGRLQAGERAATISAVAVIGAGALIGVVSDPDARQLLLSQLNGKVLPVPGVDWLRVEIGTQPDNLMLGLHVDVGALLPGSLGFGPASPSAIGGPPPTADPLAPVQRAVQRRMDGGPIPGDTIAGNRAASAPVPPPHTGFTFGSIPVYASAVQRAAAEPGARWGDGSGEDDLARRIQGAASTSGSALDGSVQRQLEGGLGADLSGVRVHTGNEADSLSRSVNAVAFTTGPNIFFRTGAYAPQSPEGQRLLAHEAVHTVQQAAGPVAGTPARGGVSISDPADHFEVAAEQQAAQVVATAPHGPSETLSDGTHQAVAPAGGGGVSETLFVQRAPGDDAGGAKTPGIPSFKQMNTPPATGAALKDLPSRNDIELMGVRLKARQTDFATFLNAAKDDVNNVRNYFKWVTDVYDQTYGIYALVIKQADAQAETQQMVVDLIFGVAAGVGIGVLSEVTLGAAAANTAFEILAEVAAEGVEGGVGLVAGISGAKEVPRAKVSEGLNPAFKQVQALQKLDELNTTVLGMSIPGPLVYGNPIVQSERLSAELRVAEAGGERRMSDNDIRLAYLKLMRFDVQSIQMENTIKMQQGKFDALRKAYMGKQAPSWQRTEQDIWITWIAEQDAGGSLFSASILENRLIDRHLVDLGLAMLGSRGGRLNADTGIVNIAITPLDAPRVPHQLPTAIQLKSGAAALQKEVLEFWKDVFLSK